MNLETIYHGRRAARQGGAGHVSVQRRPSAPGFSLNPRNDVFNHSPDGFQWGYGGSGPSQLALALTIDVLANGVSKPSREVIDQSLAVYQDVKRILIVPIQADEWTLTANDVLGAIYAAQAEVDA